MHTKATMTVAPDRTGHRRRDRGATFVEILVSVVLLGTAGIAVLTAASTAIVGARISDEIATSQATIAEVADFVTDTAPEHVTYRDCQTNSEATIRAHYQSQIDTAFGGGVAEVIAPIEFWDGSDFSGCAFAAGQRLQRISLRSIATPSERTITVVKRPTDVPHVGVVDPPSLPSYSSGSGDASVTLTDWMVGWP